MNWRAHPWTCLLCLRPLPARRWWHRLLAPPPFCPPGLAESCKLLLDARLRGTFPEDGTPE